MTYLLLIMLTLFKLANIQDSLFLKKLIKLLKYLMQNLKIKSSMKSANIRFCI